MPVKEKTERPPVHSVKSLHIGWALEWVRRQRGYRRSEVAEKIGCHKSWITRLENGENSPSFGFLEDLAKLYCMHLDTMKCGAMPMRMRIARADHRSAKKLETRVSRLPQGKEQLELAERGIRLPDDHVMRPIRTFLGIQDLRELLYGVLPNGV